MTLGALTLTITLPRSSAALTAATSKLEGMALPVGTIVVVIDGVVGALGVVAFGAGVVGVDGMAGEVILGVLGKEGVELEGLLVVKDGFDIVLTFGKIGIAL